MRDRLDDGTIRICRYHLDHLEGLHRASRESVGEVGEWMPWLDDGYMREDSRGWIEACRSAWDEAVRFEFAVESTEDGRFLGGVGLNQINREHRLANLGYWVRTSEVGRGVARRAAALAATIGFEDLRLTRLEVLCGAKNAASLRVAEILGAQREGVLRNRLVLHDGTHDAVMFSLTPEWASPFA